eukprot:m.506165 g.506165  ORF g.506165 m.506165 type:complete len:116 (+) comp57371_c0_seq8:682-1029(+)
METEAASMETAGSSWGRPPARIWRQWVYSLAHADAFAPGQTTDRVMFARRDHLGLGCYISAGIDLHAADVMMNAQSMAAMEHGLVHAGRRRNDGSAAKQLPRLEVSLDAFEDRFG